MKKHWLITLLIILFAFTNCKSKKVMTKEISVYIDSISKLKESINRKVDTVYKEKKVIITLPSDIGIEIDNPCDSLGNLKPINATIGSGKSKTTLYSIGNRMFLNHKTDSLKNYYEKYYHSKYESDSTRFEQKLISITKELKEQVTVKYFIPKWVWWVLGSYLLLIAYLFGSKWLKTTFPILKLIPF